MRRRYNPHQTIVDVVAAKLAVSGRYNSVVKNIEYHTNNLNGEFDVLTHTFEGNFWHYYEIKTHDCVKQRAKAMVQFKRAYAAFPDRSWKFVYVTSDGVERIRL